MADRVMAAPDAESKWPSGIQVFCFFVLFHFPKYILFSLCYYFSLILFTSHSPPAPKQPNPNPSHVFMWDSVLSKTLLLHPLKLGTYCAKWGRIYVSTLFISNTTLLQMTNRPNTTVGGSNSTWEMLYSKGEWYHVTGTKWWKGTLLNEQRDT